MFALSTINGFQYYKLSLTIIGIITVYILMMVFIPESPRWLLVKGQKASAILVLNQLRGPDHSIRSEVQAIEADIANSPKVNPLKQLSELFHNKTVGGRICVIIIIMFLQQMSGLNAASAYATVIFKSAGVAKPSQTASYAVGGVSIVFTVVAMFIVDCFGRKVLLVVSSVGMLSGTIMLGTHFYITRPSLCANQTSPTISSEVVLCNTDLASLAIVSLILFSAAFSIGWGPVPWILLGELIPMHVRGIGSSLATFTNWGSAAIVAGCYFKYSNLVNLWFSWWTFSVFNFVGLIFVIFFVPETKGKSLEELSERIPIKQNIKGI